MEAELAKRACALALARGRSTKGRVCVTDAYRDHGATGWRDYVACTNAIYAELVGGSASQLREALALPPDANIRDRLPEDGVRHVEVIGRVVAIQLGQRQISNAADVLRVARHVTRTYMASINAPLGLTG